MATEAEKLKAAAWAAFRAYFDSKDDDRAARDAVSKAVADWSKDQLDGVLNRNKHKLRAAANYARDRVNEVERDEKKYNARS